MNQYFKAIPVAENIYWVGAVDWAIRDFHGYSTHRGTTYNAFLIVDEKITLIDTVKAPFYEEMMARIRSVIDPSKIDYIVSNHAEMDHSGSLPQAIDDIKPEKVFASPAGVKALDAHFGIGSKITEVKSGDELKLGKNTVSFLETKMLHWPDSMFTYMKEAQILFSQDAFGMHYAVTKIFEDENPADIVLHEMSTYFANILLLYSPQILKLVADVEKMALPIKMIFPDHGPLFRNDPLRAVTLYKQWAEQKKKFKAVVAFDTMWQSTAKMGYAIADGLRESGAEVKVIPLGSGFRSDVATEILDAGALLVGSPTLNNQMFPKTADILTYIKGLRPKNLIGAAFGSFGWSGESVAQINEYLKAMNVELVSDGLKVKYVPTEADLKNCFELGLKTGNALKDKLK